MTDSSRSIYKYIAFACSGFTCILSILALLGWLTNNLILAAMSNGYIPMAPSTALCFLFIALAISAQLSDNATETRRFIIVLSLMVALFCAIVILQSAAHLNFDVESLLLQKNSFTPGIPIGRMSPVTASGMFALAIASIVLALPFNPSCFFRDLCGILGIGIFILGLVPLLGYVYGSPIFFGTDMIPISITTSLAFMFIGIGIIETAGAESFPLRFFSGESSHAKLLRTFIPVLFISLALNGAADILVIEKMENRGLAIAFSTISFSFIICGVLIIISNKVSSILDKALNAEKESVQRMRRAEIELRETLERYTSLIESTDDSIYLVDPESRYLLMNKKHLSRMRLNTEEILGRSYGDFHTPEETIEFVHQVESVLQSGTSAHHEHRSECDGGFFLRTLSPVLDSNGTIRAVTVISKNITHLKNLETELYALSLTDELTGLYNRRGFLTLADQQLKIARRIRKPMLVIFADMNDFKKINDMHGHAIGDIALKEFSTVLKETFRESDIIARIGGDEFVILITTFEAGEENAYLRRLDYNLEQFNANNTRPYVLSISTGLVNCDPLTHCTIEEMLIDADRLMYEQKTASQKNRPRSSDQ